ncbi:MAG: hypothetical protein WCN95_05275 [bacterium]
MADYQSRNTNAASTLPSNKDEKEDLAWTMCVLMMATKQLALINKTGQVNFEINGICRLFIDWIRNLIQTHFASFFSSMLLLSYDRVIAGYLTRQVATTFMSTCARHYSESASVTEANANALKDMETSPITLQSCNLAICNAITHLVDTNLILVNQLIRDKLRTPIVSMEFMKSILIGESIDMSSPFYDLVFTWASQMVQNRQQDAECIQGYISVSKLGTQEDYNSKEAYLESFFGVAKSNFYTYSTAIKECCGKTFDLTGFLNMDASMLDFSRFIGRLGVGGDGLILARQQQTGSDHGRSTYMFVQSGQPVQGAAVGASKAWVSLMQHLLITSIQGNQDLHADNIFTFGANLTEFILSYCAPVQSAPARCMVLESFTHINEDVLPLQMNITRRPEYFVRTINDHGALETGLTSELPAIIGTHPPEDVMHLGSWIQLYTIIHNGVGPSEFRGSPSYNGRPPELVMDRRYPLECPEQTTIGTIILLSTGAARIMIGNDNTWEPPLLVALNQWWITLETKSLMVAPLVFRHHAVFRPDDGECIPWVAINYGNDEGQFLSMTGKYTLAREAGNIQTVTFSEAHRRLLPIGTHILVRSGAVRHFGVSSGVEWLMGCLRYPDSPTEEENSDANQHSIYVTLRVKANPGAEPIVKIVYVNILDCSMIRGGSSYAEEALQEDILTLMRPNDPQ